jgi:hypothetical protein
MWVIGIAAQYREFGSAKEPFCTKNNQLWIDSVIEIKRESFIKALFLCLLLCTLRSVDKPLRATYLLMYRGIKGCVHLAMS